MNKKFDNVSFKVIFSSVFLFSLILGLERAAFAIRTGGHGLVRPGTKDPLGVRGDIKKHQNPYRQRPTTSSGHSSRSQSSRSSSMSRDEQLNAAIAGRIGQQLPTHNQNGYDPSQMPTAGAPSHRQTHAGSGFANQSGGGAGGAHGNRRGWVDPRGVSPGQPGGYVPTGRRK